MCISHLLELENSSACRNRKEFDIENGACIYVLAHGVERDAEALGALIKRKMRGRPTRIFWRPGMEIEGTVAYFGKDLGGYYDIGNEGDQTRPLKVGDAD